MAETFEKRPRTGGDYIPLGTGELIDHDDYTEAGFAEIWIADHSTIDAFGRVELFGLHPERIAGYYALTAGCKPYG